MFTISVTLIGVYLISSSLIVTALATTGMCGKSRLYAAYATGIYDYVSRLILFAMFDLPSGAMIVWTFAICGILAQLMPFVGRDHLTHEVDHKIAQSEG